MEFLAYLLDFKSSVSTRVRREALKPLRMSVSLWDIQIYSLGRRECSLGIAEAIRLSVPLLYGEAKPVDMV